MVCARDDSRIGRDEKIILLINAFAMLLLLLALLLVLLYLGVGLGTYDCFVSVSVWNNSIRVCVYAF